MPTELRVGLTMREVHPSGYDEPRDALARAWGKFMREALPEAAWMPFPNVGSDLAPHYCDRWGLNALILTGGASRSPLWTQMIADIAGRTLTLPSTSDAGCLGAAALGGTAAGLFSSLEQGASILTGKRRQVDPGPDAPRYQDVLARYKSGAARMAPVQEDKAHGAV
jgi:glycerol kinase